MKKNLVILFILALSVTSAWADIKASTTTATRDILLFEEENIDVLANVQVSEISKNDFHTSFITDREDGVYSSGERIVFTFKAEEDSYLTILDFTPSGQILVLFPNQWVSDNHIKVGQEVIIPAEGQNFSMRAGNVMGVDVVKAIATNKDVQIFNEDNKELFGPFAKLQDPKAGTRDILLFAEDPDPNPDLDDPLKWSVATVAVMTHGEGSDRATGFAAAKNETQSVQMWANAANYLIGENVFVKLLSNEPATLVSLVNRGASETENNLLPEGTKITVEAGEVLVLPRKDDKWKLVAASDTGIDVLVGKLTFADGSELELSLEVTVEEDED